MQISLSPRSAAFYEAARQRATSKPASHRQASWLAARELYCDEPPRRRAALIYAYALTHEPVFVFDDELISGMLYWGEGFGTPDIEDGIRDAAARIAAELPAQEVLWNNGDASVWTLGIFMPGHIAWHWDWIVAEGVEGVRRRIDAAWPDADADGREALDAMRIVLQGVLDWVAQYRAVWQEKLAAATTPEQRLRATEQLESLERVPRFGARNFREAVQAFQFAYLAGWFECPHGGNSPGRLDYFLWPYLERDLAAGTTTMAAARDLVDELFIRFQERLRWTMDGFVETVVLGGTAPDGRCAASPLTRIMVESFAALPGVTHPAIYLRLAADAPEWVRDLGYDYLIAGGNRAQLLNDAAVIQAMSADGAMPVADARDYMCGGCMELSSQGRNGDLSFTNFFSVAKILEYVLTGGECLQSRRRVLDHLGNGLTDYADFEALYAAFEAELTRVLELGFRGMELTAEAYARHRPAWLLSALIEDCIQRGRPINTGGARYEDIGSTPLGIPNAADSLLAIRRAVYEEKWISAAALLDALRHDFAGAEALRLRLNALPKYGRLDAEADDLMSRVTATVCAIYRKRRNRNGGIFKPMIMTFMMSPVVGRMLGAGADGRRAGTPIAHGITPQNRAMTGGLGRALLSATAIPVDRFSGGASHIWDLEPEFANRRQCKQLIDVFFERGGQMFQGNVIDPEQLKQARLHPEEYPNLTVRVGGYSARFTELPPENQEEIITRCFHGQ